MTKVLVNAKFCVKTKCWLTEKFGVTCCVTCCVTRTHVLWHTPCWDAMSGKWFWQNLSFGNIFQTFCDEHSKICGEKGNKVQKNNLTSLMSSIWLAHLEDYEQSVRECIPTSKLLNISLGWYNETSETKLFKSFFELPSWANDIKKKSPIRFNNKRVLSFS